VVGSQAGKSGGSILQQALLLLTGGVIAGSLPVMFAVYIVMANGWLRSVARLSDHNPRYGQTDDSAPTLTSDESDATLDATASGFVSVEWSGVHSGDRLPASKGVGGG
jgi:AAA family ATP:ADP antiporter